MTDGDAQNPFLTPAEAAQPAAPPTTPSSGKSSAPAAKSSKSKKSTSPSSKNQTKPKNKPAPKAPPADPPTKKPKEQKSEEKPAEKPNEEPAETLDEDLDTALLDEDDENDFWWVLQNFITSSFRTLVVIFLIGGVLWLIWSNNQAPLSQWAPDTDTTSATSSTTSTPTPATPLAPPVTTPSDADTDSPPWWKFWASDNPNDSGLTTTTNSPSTPVSAPNQPPTGNTTSQPSSTTGAPSLDPQHQQDIIRLAQWHTRVESPTTDSTTTGSGTGPRPSGSTGSSGGSPSAAQTPIAQALDLLATMQFKTQTPVSQFIQGRTTDIRAQKINQYLQEIERDTSQANALRAQLGQLQSTLTTRQTQAQQQADALSAQIGPALDSLSSDRTQTLLAQHITAKNQVYEAQAQNEIVRLIITKLDEQSNGLRTIAQSIYANQAALIQDIRVVDFPSDPFGRVIPYEQWQQQQ